MVLNKEYESEIMVEFKKIIRAVTEIEDPEFSKNGNHVLDTANMERTGRNGETSKESRLVSSNSGHLVKDTSITDLNGISINSRRIHKARMLKKTLSNLFARIENDIECLSNPPPCSTHPILKRAQLSDKQFIACNSILSDLLQVHHFRTIYNIFVVILLMLFLNTVVHDYVVDGSINVGLQPIRLGFRQFHFALYLWMFMQMYSMSLWGLFRTWSILRNVQHGPKPLKLWDLMGLSGFILYQVSMIVGTVFGVFKLNLPIASTVAIMMELTRFLMKNHAYVRSNVPKVRYAIEKENHFSGPTFGTFIYFQFAPTLVYRDNYPQSHLIRWSRVAWTVVEVVGVIFYVSFIFERFLLPYYRPFGLAGTAGMNAQSVVMAVFGSLLPATLAYLCGFYCLLHAWMNGWAEMLRFGDRQFYRDWWNATSYDVYYRTWNCVVHDWLYTYVYKDVYTMWDVAASPTLAKLWATVAVFSLSAIFHEFILAVSFGFFYPVLLTMFLGVGMLLSCVRAPSNSRVGNIWMWFSIAMGNGLCFSLYCMEYFARVNCVVRQDRWTEYIVPVSWRCNGL